MSLTRYRCPNELCGWYRDYDPKSEEVIDHIKYGMKPVRDIAALEIRQHSCEANLTASSKARRMLKWYRIAGRTVRGM